MDSIRVNGPHRRRDPFFIQIKHDHVWLKHLVHDLFVLLCAADAPTSTSWKFRTFFRLLQQRMRVKVVQVRTWDWASLIFYFLQDDRYDKSRVIVGRRSEPRRSKQKGRQILASLDRMIWASVNDKVSFDEIFELILKTMWYKVCKSGWP